MFSAIFRNFALDEYSSWIVADGGRDSMQVDPSRSQDASHLYTFCRSKDVVMIPDSAGSTFSKGVGRGWEVTERVRSHAAM